MADYLTIAVIHILVGFEIFTLGFLNTDGNSQNVDWGKDEETIEALLIIAFLCYLVGVILTVLIKTGDLAGNMIAMIVTLILVLVAAVFIIAGSAIWYDDWGKGNGGVNEYVMTLDIAGGCLAAIGGIFLIVVLATGGGGSTSPA